MRIFMGLAIALSFFGCQQQGIDARFDHEGITVPKGMGQDRDFRGEDAPEFLAVKTLDALFEFEKVVPLQTTDESVVGVVTDLLFHRNQWYILDQMTCSVYRFREDGSFVGKFGRRGPGPGEFEYPKRIRRCFNDFIGVADPVQGKIHLFQSSGEYVRATRARADDMTILPRYTFAWNEEDTLVIPGFGSNNPNAPSHAVVDGRQMPYRLRFGFGERIETIERAILKGAATRAYTAFEEIEGRYWTGSPFKTSVEVFTKNGELLGRLGEKGPRNREAVIGPDDYEGVHLKRDPAKFMRGEINRKRGNGGIFKIGDWVFVRMGRYYDVYRPNGQRIAANLRANYLQMNYGVGEWLVMVIPAGMDLSAMPEGPLKQTLQENGYNPQDNPFLAIYRLLSDWDLG